MAARSGFHAAGIKIEEENDPFQVGAETREKTGRGGEGRGVANGRSFWYGVFISEGERERERGRATTYVSPIK